MRCTAWLGANSNFAFWNFLGLLFSNMFICGWLIPWTWNPQIQRADCVWQGPVGGSQENVWKHLQEKGLESVPSPYGDTCQIWSSIYRLSVVPYKSIWAPYLSCPQPSSCFNLEGPASLRQSRKIRQKKEATIFTPSWTIGETEEIHVQIVT